VGSESFEAKTDTFIDACLRSRMIGFFGVVTLDIAVSPEMDQDGTFGSPSPGVRRRILPSAPVAPLDPVVSNPYSYEG
jgi:hypothetical protein